MSTFIAPSLNLKLDRCFVKCLQEAVSQSKLSDGAMNVLTNIQDCRNSLNCNVQKDALQRVTFEPCVANQKENESVIDSDDVNDEEMEEALTRIFSALDTGQNKEIPQNEYSTKLTREAAVGDCANTCVKETKVRKNSNFIFQSRRSQPNSATSEEVFDDKRHTVSQEMLTTLAAKSFMHGNQSLGEAVKNKQIKATGSAISIVHFGRSRGLDDEQQRAFEVITAMFVLSYCKDATISRDENFLIQPTKRARMARSDFTKQRARLETLAGGKR